MPSTPFRPMIFRAFQFCRDAITTFRERRPWCLRRQTKITRARAWLDRENQARGPDLRRDDGPSGPPTPATVRTASHPILGMSTSPAEPVPGGQASARFFVGDRVGITVAAVLLLLSAVSWALTYYSMPLMTMGNAGMGSMGAAAGAAALASSIEPGSVALFELVWVLGMVAMMFPAMIPIVMFYDRAVTKLEPNPAR